MCRQCEFLFACHGECPKNRVLTTPDGEPGLKWLCPGLKAFFAHTRRPLQVMAQLVSQGRPADLVMGLVAEAGRSKEDAEPDTEVRNDRWRILTRYNPTEGGFR